MIRKKANLVIGLTTFNNEMLRISVPALGKFAQKFTLVIHNDNPVTTVSRRQIRRMGYCGDLHIINSTQNVGLMRSRMAIVQEIRNIGINPDWFIFCDDDDILVNIDMPDVSNENFAVIQNAIAIRHRMGDMLRAMDSPTDIDPDGENIIFMRPNIGFAGNIIRGTVMFGLNRILQNISDAILQIDDSLEYMPPTDAIMWAFVNIYAKHVNQNSAPIYMDKIGYIKNELDTARMKYGRLARPVRNPNEHYRRAIAKYTAILNSALDAAALRG